MKLDFLENHKEAIPLIAGWYREQWGYMTPERTQDQFETHLKNYLNSDKIPLMVLARENHNVLGVAQLKYREMDIYPEKEHWLGGVYVDPKHRGKQIARRIIEKIISVAQQLNVSELHLQTIRHDGGLYCALGWQAVERVHYYQEDVLVMVNHIQNRPPP